MSASLIVGCAADPRVDAGAAGSGAEAEAGRPGEGRVVAPAERARAARAFEAAVARAPDAPREALAQLDEAIAADPDHALARVHAAELRLELGEELARASTDLRHALTLLPTSPRAHLRAGQVAWAQQDAPRAEAMLLRAVQLKPDWLDPQLVLVDVLMHLGRAPDAVAAAEKARALAPERTDVVTRLCDTLAAAGRPADAARELEALAVRVGSSAPLFRRAARLWADAGQPAEAARLEARADKLDPPPKAKKTRALPPARK